MEEQNPPLGDRPLPPPPETEPRAHPRPGGSRFFDSMRTTGVVRTQDRWIGGVGGGLARRIGVDPLLVRGLLGVTALLGGAGLVLYGIAWALLPEEADGRIHLEETVRGRFDPAILGALAFVIVGVNRGTGWNGWWNDAGLGWVNGVLWIAALAAVVAVVVAAANQRSSDRAAGPPSASSWAPPPPPPADRRTSHTVPHPGYGAVPLASPAPPMGHGGSGATATRPAQPVVPPPPPLPPRTPGPRVLGPGVGMVGTVVGLTLLALAGLLLVEREGRLGQPVLPTALGIGIVLAGLAIMVSGLRGRRSGTLGFLAVLGVVVGVPAAIVSGQDDRIGLLWGDVDGTLVSTGETWRPDTVAEARRGLSVRFGDVDVDLTDVPLGGGTVEVPIRLGAGELEVVVPRDVAVGAEITVAAGQATWDVDGRSAAAGFSGGRSEVYSSEEVVDGGEPDLSIRITAGAGDVRVVEEDR